MGKHLTIKLLLFLSLFILCYTTGFAQGGDVTGRVTDASDGQTLPGVTVLIKNATLGTVTDMDGNYKIRVNPNTTLVFSFIGYETQEILVQPNTIVNVALTFKSTYLTEMVVIGYGIQKKDDVTGSLSAVQVKDFNKGSIVTPSDLLIGKIPGVQITSTGGSPGSGTAIRIRGGSSLSASNDPLIVIDGVPVDNEGISGTRNALSLINPNDIETFTVLKDASATAIFGSRASNGVIMITTKKGAIGKGGKESKSINLSYNGTFSVYTVPKMIDVLKADEYRTIMKDRYAGNETILSLLGTASTDWQKEIYQTALGMDHYLSATGAFKVLPYKVSLGYSDENGILKTDNMKRTTLSASLNPSLFDDHLKINFNVKGMFVKNKFADQGAIGAAVQYDPTKPVKSDSVFTVHYTNVDNNPDSLTTDFGGYYAWTQPNGAPVSQGSSNPVALLNMRDDKSDVKRIIGNIQFDYKLHFFPDLRANLNIGYDYSKSDGTVYVPDYAPWEFDAVYGGGLSTVYKQEKKNELFDFYMNYVKNVSDIKSTFDIMAGYSWQHFWRKGSNYSTNIIKTVVNDSSDYATESYLISFFGRLNYSLLNRYLITFTFRDDASSKLSPDKRWGLFPSVAIGWKINEEPWMKDVTILSQLKLRAGYGITGQQDILQGDYPYMPRYTYSEPNAMYQFGHQFLLTLRPNGFDKNIKWEEATTWNLGLDYGFAKDRFYGSLDMYYKQTRDLINFIPVPAGSNLTNYIVTNVGDMDNKGVEFSINTKPVSKENFFWEVNLNVAYNFNKITKLTVTEDPNYVGVLTGGISGGVGNTCQVNSVGYAANSFFVFEQVYDNNGNPIEGMYVDRNGDGQITDNDRYRYKDPAPDYSLGLSSSLQYKNWSFSFAGHANIGNYVYNNVISENAVWERLYRPEGPYIGNVTSDVKTINFVSPRYLSNYFIQDGSFFRMDNITLSYLFDRIIQGKVKLLLSATVNNAFIITRYTGIDPEIAAIDNRNVTYGIDNRIYPRPRVFVFGVNLMF